LLPDVERVCDHAMIMHQGRVRFVGTIEELRGARGSDRALAVEVKADAERFATVLAGLGATTKVMSPVALHVDLPADATSKLVFTAARDANIQIRGLETRRETIEAAFLRVISGVTL
jgi:ABC-type multidrug transport system ATPase subunit